MKRRIKKEIAPDEIFLDSKNIPQFNTYQMEGRLEMPIKKKSFWFLSLFFLLVAGIFLSKLFSLQVVNGESYFLRSENNRLKKTFILPNRGIIYDRNGEKLVWNDLGSRKYTELSGLNHILGYIGLPSVSDLSEQEDQMMEAWLGKDGIEKFYSENLFGVPGTKIVEVDSQNQIISESIQQWPEDGKDVNLSIDSKLQSQLYNIISSVAKDHGFQGASGVIMDVNNGELLALTNYPEYSSQILSQGEPEEDITGFLNNPQKPFLNRQISGLYAPGSIIKPLMALAALNENIISPEKQIFSAGSISIPNPYNPGQYTIFKDWKAHGWVDMRHAIAVSSDVYFYEVGGGFEDQKGLGVSKIKDYMERFGFDSLTGIDLFGEVEGFVPDPDWKRENASEPEWRLGDTYNLSIGQGFLQVTPLEILVMVSAIANNGKVIQPHLLKDKETVIKKDNSLEIPEKYFDIVKEGMRLGVLEGTASALNISGVKIAAKTGTAEVGVSKGYINSWIMGFFPYGNPKYAFVIMFEKAKAGTTIGGLYSARQLFDWMSIYTPEYLK